MVTRRQPGLQARFRVRQVDIGDAQVGKAEFTAPCLDGARQFVQVGSGCGHTGKLDNRSAGAPRNLTSNTVF
ncbi:hypothetical protein [Massilia sp. Dwa41.01b]|uniref:hypothetical protein n=1 Tax=unclassified Massilia TaxID=2609279 RepID=UPI001E59A3E4|nr:hypothetical protein [Massilia sp. Dwa41.01b]